MAELEGLHVRITGDASSLKTEVNEATTQITRVGTAAQTAQGKAGGLTGAFGKLGNVTGQTRARIQNASFQISDIAVQLQGGAKASTAFAQQLPQLLGGFGALGAVLGVVAGVGIPALALAFGSLGGSVQTMEQRLEALKAKTDEMNAVNDILKMSVYELRDAYGEAADRVRAFALVQAELAAAQAASRMSEQVDILRDAASMYTTASIGGRDYANTIARIGRDFGLAKDEAVQFEALLESVNSAGTFEDQQAALQKVLDFLKLNNVELSKIPPELQRAISEMITFSNETDRARAIMSDLSAEAAGVTIGVGLSSDDPNLLPPAEIADPPKTVRKSGASQQDKIARELEALTQSLMTQEELQIASFERQQETLVAALDQKLLTQEEYNALMQDAALRHSEAMAQIDAYRYGTGIQQAGKFFGEMAGALQSGNDKMASIGKKFAAIETLINAWRAYSQVLADPSLPWFAKIPAATSVLAAGMGAVNAIKGGGSGGGSGGGGSSASTATAAAAQPTTTFAFTIQNDPMGFCESFARQIIEQLNTTQRNGGNIRGVLA